ncbi:glycoside hydrolase family 5 protein [Vibrio aestuarianus]|uniref:glycoside hydrolase family 5 protein n=1 Tax=Vibrio aestuarianus TaxID=28171 RepID=UPI00237D0F70|nr:cellulase family glycosylhydrolase [Vibrio aestuarianus]
MNGNSIFKSTDWSHDPALGRGINMGNYLESPTYEGEWNNNLIIQASDFRNINQTGFSSVRIPVRWSAHTLTNDPNIIDDAFLSRVQEVVDQAIQEDLKVIINTHHFDELFYDDKDFDYQRSRLLKFWDQISKRFPISQYNQDQLIFEFLNEPHEDVGIKEWNSLISDLTNIVWHANSATQNNALGQRKVMVGPADWGEYLSYLIWNCLNHLILIIQSSQCISTNRFNSLIRGHLG